MLEQIYRLITASKHSVRDNGICEHCAGWGTIADMEYPFSGHRLFKTCPSCDGRRFKSQLALRKYVLLKKVENAYLKLYRWTR